MNSRALTVDLLMQIIRELPIVHSQPDEVPNEITVSWRLESRLHQMGIGLPAPNPFSFSPRVWVDPTLGPDEWYWGRPKAERLGERFKGYLVVSEPSEDES